MNASRSALIVSAGRGHADKMAADRLNLIWLRSPPAHTASEPESLSAPEQNAPRSAAEAAHERANPARNGETHSPNAIALERRKLSVKVVNLKPRRQRRVPSVEVRRAEHRHVSKDLRLIDRIRAGPDLNVTGLWPQQDTNQAQFNFVSGQERSARSVSSRGYPAAASA